MELFDIGANLGHESFDQDLPDVLARAREAGISRIVVTGASRDGSPKALQLAQAHPGFLYATAGVHPHHAVEYTEECDVEMRALHQHAEVLAVGECGLDYFRDLAPRPAQRKAFERQLQLAVELGKPLFLHQRDGHEDFMAMMKNFDGLLGRAVVQPVGQAHAGQHGITGWLCDERRGLHLRELVKSIPAERLMIETDAPYLLPRSVKPMPSHRRNEPMYLKHIVEELAKDRGESVEACAGHSTRAAREFFGLDAGADA